jgi:hypothetical protein
MNLNSANWGLIVSLAAMLIVIVPVWKDIYIKNRSTRFVDKFTTVGKVLIFICLAFIFINYLKDKQSEYILELAEKAKIKADSITSNVQNKLTNSQNKIERYQDSLYSLQLSIKDTILKEVDTSYRKSIKASNEAIAKYHLKIIDSLHTVVGTLKLNSANPQLAVAPVDGNNPPVYLENESSDTFKIKFISANSTSYHIRIKAYFILSTDRRLFLMDSAIIFKGQQFINTQVVSTQSLVISNKLLSLGRIVVALKGSFSKDPFEKEIIPYLQAFEFDFRTNKFVGKIEMDMIQLENLIAHHL